MPIAKLDGLQTRYEVIGQGPPILMYAPGGFDATLEKWSTQGIYAKIKPVENLSKHYTCIVFDRRECGQSGGRIERITSAHYVTQGLALLDHLKIDKAHIMGGCMGCSPVIAMTGGPAPLARHRHAYQEIEDYTQFEHTTKFNAHVDSVDRLPDLIRQAFREATTGCPGPVHLEMRGHHAEVAHAEAELKLIVEERYKQVQPFRPSADPVAVETAVKLLDAAERPVIVAGGGVMVGNDVKIEISVEAHEAKPPASAK